MGDTRAIIVELLRNIGGRKEVAQYLKHYCSVDTHKFAVIALDRAILDRPLRIVAAALSFLHEVGLYPIVVHAAGPRLDGALAEAGLARDSSDEAPATTPQALDIIRRVYQQENLELVEALEAQGCPARPIPSGVLEAAAPAAGSLFGEMVDVDRSALSSAIRARKLPIVASLATSPTGQLLDVHPEAAAMALARRIESHKVIFLTERGGIHDDHDRLVSAINLSEDAARLFNSDWLGAADRRRLEGIAELLHHLPPSSSVSITSPDHLARELFTHRGAGTLVRRGEAVEQHEDFDQVDRDRLRGLIDTCFGRALVDDYFETRRCHRLYVSESYRATAIVTLEGGQPYLDKFAVTHKAQGEGLGGSVWDRMRADHPRLFWRSRSDNAVNGWYFQQADGCLKSGQWTVFWYGLDDFEQARECIDGALALPASLAEESDG
jgi:bifunctional N-acetylglutamate synthase/kinase